MVNLPASRFASRSGIWTQIWTRPCFHEFRILDDNDESFRARYQYFTPKITICTTATLFCCCTWMNCFKVYWGTTSKIQNTILKPAQPFQLQIQFLQLIQFFPWHLYTNYLLVRSIWLRNEAFILFSCCVPDPPSIPSWLLVNRIPYNVISFE